MQELDQFFTEIGEEIAKEYVYGSISIFIKSKYICITNIFLLLFLFFCSVNKKSLLQDLEHRFDLSIIPFLSQVTLWTSTSPNKLKEVINKDAELEGELRTNLQNFNQELSTLECKAGQKERLSNKFIEDSIQILLSKRYFQVLSNAFENDPINIDLVTNGDKLGVIATPTEIYSSLNVQEINYQTYLIALLKLIDIIVDYTTTTVINQSIGSANVASPNYTIGLINLQIVSKIQNGFLLLDLKNDILRKKYDSLKYSSQRLNKIVYDLSLRNLITTSANIQ